MQLIDTFSYALELAKAKGGCQSWPIRNLNACARRLANTHLICSTTGFQTPTLGYYLRLWMRKHCAQYAYTAIHVLLRLNHQDTANRIYWHLPTDTCYCHMCTAEMADYRILNKDKSDPAFPLVPRLGALLLMSLSFPPPCRSQARSQVFLCCRAAWNDLAKN
ncbi:hypothetical protein AG1IA_09873 [Rhizoctonia solani AG-1 IA]|uniref:Uncharacterized protein n=1 Tax=Thanatephorus cucumeris (strain AG1-IA) TaxID=983506 RepID=L8WH87_THACA|nr:hypothetical protein AG1IA_09873 [Rhizoctonia solani AG-1 IA]